LGRVVKKNLADGVIDELRRMMEKGELKEGDKLPNQYELAAKLGVSRPCLREAFHTLALMGVIEQAPGIGTVLRRQIPDIPPNQFTLPLVSDAVETRELIEARSLIEVGMVEFAVQKATDAQVQRMGILVEEMSHATSTNNLDEYIEKDKAFHHLIAEASNNRFLAAVFTEVRHSMDEFIKESFSVLPGMSERSLNAHRRIFKAIKERDRNKAAKEMTRHLSEVQEAIERYYSAAKNIKQADQVAERAMDTLPSSPG
jgi:GntR family transcriptional regulator, transcriptional repressor for pyruvate dehydrogenase complex